MWYAGPLLRLLDVPGRKRLETRLVLAVERAERGGVGLAEAFRDMDTSRRGEIRSGGRQASSCSPCRAVDQAEMSAVCPIC